MTNIPQQAFDRWGATLIAMLFLHLLDPAEALMRGDTRLLRRQSRGSRVALSELEVRPYFVVQLTIEPVPEHHCEKTSDRPSHGLTVRNRARSAVDCSQFAIWTRSCFAPVRVSS
jgi:hypothetical protein